MIDDAMKITVFMRVWEVVFASVIRIDTPTTTVDAAVSFTGVVTQRLLAEMERRFQSFCEWKSDETDDSWNGSCGVKWCFQIGGPIDNKMNHCPSCGRLMKVK